LIQIKTTTGGDITANNRLFVLGDTSLNGNVYVARSANVSGDATIAGNLLLAGNNVQTQIGNALSRSKYIMSDASDANTMIELK